MHKLGFFFVILGVSCVGSASSSLSTNNRSGHTQNSKNSNNATTKNRTNQTGRTNQTSRQTHGQSSNSNNSNTSHTNNSNNTNNGTAIKILLSDLKAFPTAYGAGAVVAGGRGGTVHWVTTTAPSGAGSLQEALTNGTGNKTIMFSVGGSFQHNYHLYSDLNKVTIAGQSAHDLGGVYIDNDGDNAHFFYLDMEDSIWRYIATRGNRIPPDYDGEPVLYTNKGSVIFDHFTDFGGNSASGPRAGINVTVQYSLATEATSADHQDTGFQTYQPSYEGPSGYFDYIYNAMILKSHRSPSLSGNQLVKHRVVGNFVYGWSGRHMNIYGTPKVDIYNNVYQESKAGSGSHTKGNTYAVEYQPAAGEGHGSIYLKNNWHRKNDFSELFTIDNANVEFHKPDPDDPNALPTPRSKPMDPPEYLSIMKTPVSVRDHVLENAGAGVRYSQTGPKTVVDFEKKYKEWAKNQSEEGTRESRSAFETIPEKSRNLTAFEKVHGFPESWALKHGLGVGDDVHNLIKKDWKGLNGLYVVTNTAGYTNLEIYLAELAGDFHMLSNL